jgi:trimeric autotransporter adhesin
VQRLILLSLALALLPSAQPAVAQTYTWLPTFGGYPGADAAVWTFHEHDDGSGPALYMGGDFKSVAGYPASGIAKWDGVRWSTLHHGVSTTPSGSWTKGVRALITHDDGSGAALYVGGHFQTNMTVPEGRNLVRWNGSSWSLLQLGKYPNDSVEAFVVHDDGTGAALYLGGKFTSIGNAGAYNRVAKWTGTEYQPLGHGLHGDVTALASFQTMSERYVIAAGEFHWTAGAPATPGKYIPFIAKWDGHDWHPVGSPIRPKPSASVPRLWSAWYQGQRSRPTLLFRFPGGVHTGFVPGSVIAWDGSSWSNFGSSSALAASAVSVFDDGNGERVYVGSSTTATSGVFRRDDSGWTKVAHVANNIQALHVSGLGSKPTTWIGTGSWTVPGLPKRGVETWDGSDGLDTKPIAKGVDGKVLALATTTESGSPVVYAGGEFRAAGGMVVDRVAKWTNGKWAPLASGFKSDCIALAMFDDGAGEKLYASETVGVQAPSGLRRWDGQSWSTVPGGAATPAMHVHDHGSGPRLHIGTMPVRAYDGAAWTTLGASGWAFSPWPGIAAFATFDDGAGPKLYAAGGFTQVEGTPMRGVIRWNGTAWEQVGALNNYTRSLVVHDDGSGPALYVGGFFNKSGSETVRYIAKWDGSAWVSVGTIGSIVETLLSVTTPEGPRLIAGGDFVTADGKQARNLAMWDGTEWWPMATKWPEGTWSIFDTTVTCLAKTPGPLGDELIVGGKFGFSPGRDSNIARWGAPSVFAVSGCVGSASKLVALEPVALLGAPLGLSVDAASGSGALVAFFAGLPGWDASGCGSLLLPTVEWLLAPHVVPALLAIRSVGTTPAVKLDVHVPDTPSLTGVGIAIQAIEFSGAGFVASNALSVVLGP